MIYENNMEITIWVCSCQNKPVYVIALTTRSHAYVLALLRFYIVKSSKCIVFFFWFYKIFFINLCSPYSRFDGAWSCVKVRFGSFGSMRFNLRWDTYLVLQSYCYYLCCLIASCLYFFQKKNSYRVLNGYDYK